MATSQYTYQPYHTIGAALLLVWDELAGGGSGGWQSVGKVADAALNVATEQVAKEIITKGLSQPIAQRNRSKRYSLSFRLLENANPHVLGLLLSDGAAQSVNSEIAVVEHAVLRLYSADYTELSHPYGLVSATPPEVQSYDGLTTYVVDIDYETDLEKGLIKRKTGGSIPDGAKLYVEYTYTQSANVVTSIGDSVDLERYKKVKLLQLEADGADPSKWKEAGLEFEFHRVNINGADTTILFSEDDFSEGASASWDCLYSSAEAGVGTVRSSYGVLAEFS